MASLGQLDHVSRVGMVTASSSDPGRDQVGLGDSSRSGPSLWSALEEFVGEAVPGAKVGPLMCAGFTDSHWLREAFGTVAYGFFPSSGELPAEVAATLVHSADERIPVADLELGVGWLRHAAHAMLR